MQFSQNAYLYDVRDVAQPQEIAHWSNGGGPGEEGWFTMEDADGPRCVIHLGAVGGYGRRLVTVTVAEVFDELLPLHGPVSLAGERAFQFAEWADGDPAVACLDLSDPAAASVLGAYPDTFYRAPLALSETLVMVWTGAELRILDFADPGNPQMRGSVAATALADWLGRVGDLVFAGSASQSYAVDVADPDAPAIVWSTPGEVEALAWRDDHVVLAHAAGEGHLHVYRRTASGLEAVGAPFAVGADAHAALAWHGDVLYTGGIAAFDVADPAAPAFLGGSPQNAGHVSVRDDLLATPRGLYPLHCAATGVAGPAAASLAIRVHPNPFNPRTVLSFTLADGGPTRVTVHDVRGRLVRTLVDGVLPAGRRTVAWDGRDQGGRRLAAGVYRLRVVGGDAASACWVTMVK